MLGHQAEQLHRVGLVGAGEVVRRFYLPVFRSRADIRVQAICSRDRRRATEVAQLLDIPTVAADHRALLDDEGIESVLVCTPPHTHLEIASHAFGRGKNVLLEKPPCRTYEEFASLQALAARCRRVLDVTFNNSAREDNAWLIDAVKQGRIGAVELIELEWLRTKPRPDKAWARSAHCAGGGGRPGRSRLALAAHRGCAYAARSVVRRLLHYNLSRFEPRRGRGYRLRQHYR